MMGLLTSKAESSDLSGRKRGRVQLSPESVLYEAR
jgi:hypothetical protein